MVRERADALARSIHIDDITDPIAPTGTERLCFMAQELGCEVSDGLVLAGPIGASGNPHLVQSASFVAGQVCFIAPRGAPLHLACEGGALGDISWNGEEGRLDTPPHR